ncbi:MAG: hypothetical protein ACRD9W_27995 [Terriglobia bacterium]
MIDVSTFDQDQISGLCRRLAQAAKDRQAAERGRLSAEAWLINVPSVSQIQRLLLAKSMSAPDWPAEVAATGAVGVSLGRPSLAFSEAFVARVFELLDGL